MSVSRTEPNYLDAIFASLRTLSREITAMKGFLRAAESAAQTSWGMQFLAAAQAADARARAGLEAAEARIRDLGPEDEVPAPLDKLPSSVAAIRGDLRALMCHLTRLESEAGSRPIGRA